MKKNIKNNWKLKKINKLTKQQQYKTKPRKNEICLNRTALSSLKDLPLFLLFVPFRILLILFSYLPHFRLNEIFVDLIVSLFFALCFVMIFSFIHGISCHFVSLDVCYGYFLLRCMALFPLLSEQGFLQCTERLEFVFF